MVTESFYPFIKPDRGTCWFLQPEQYSADELKEAEKVTAAIETQTGGKLLTYTPSDEDVVHWCADEGSLFASMTCVHQGGMRGELHGFGHAMVLTASSCAIFSTVRFACPPAGTGTTSMPLRIMSCTSSVNHLSQTHIHLLPCGARSRHVHHMGERLDIV